MNIDHVFQGLLALDATWVLWLLVGLSVIAVAVIFERAAFFWSTGVNPFALRMQLNEGLARSEPAKVKQQLNESRSMEARIVGAGVGASCPEEAAERMAAEAQVQRLRSERYLAYLGTLGNNAPFVGLLGTVIGIIGAFKQLDASGGQLTTGLMAAIGEALVATAVGILVALPAVAAYNAFQRAIAVRLNCGDLLGRELMAHLHALAQGVDPKAAVNIAHTRAGE
jgi:biopolymer transport protein ExbB